MGEYSKIQVWRSPELDGFEIKNATFYNRFFPKHFHTAWSLGIVNMGCEHLLVEDIDLLLFSNATILIPPYSVHANWGNKDSPWAYQSLYINEDVVKRYAKKNNLDYSELVDQSYYLAYNVPHFDATSLNHEVQIDKLLSLIFSDRDVKRKRGSRHEILDYLNLNYKNRITLSGLEQVFKMNKYKLLREFKRQIGLTPYEYTTALRMENAKKSFFKKETIAAIALDNGFYDQSHFVSTFKKYFGVTPNTYKSNCNILQDGN